jgi:hypothetical protein
MRIFTRSVAGCDADIESWAELRRVVHIVSCSISTSQLLGF